MERKEIFIMAKTYRGFEMVVVMREREEVMREEEVDEITGEEFNAALKKVKEKDLLEKTEYNIEE